MAIETYARKAPETIKTIRASSSFRISAALSSLLTKACAIFGIIVESLTLWDEITAYVTKKLFNLIFHDAVPLHNIFHCKIHKVVS